MKNSLFLGVGKREDSLNSMAYRVNIFLLISRKCEWRFNKIYTVFS